MAESVTVALDWTPNTNHVGFYVAQALGYYEKSGLSVTLLSPHLDNYATTPASRVTSKTATFALAPSETVISYHLPPVDPLRFKLTAVATLLQHDLSAIGWILINFANSLLVFFHPHILKRSVIVILCLCEYFWKATLKNSGISRPQDLDGRTYASYGARFEGRIVQNLIQSDGGKGQFVEMTPEKLGIWDILVAGKADATWIFKGWEGVEARLAQIELHEFSLTDYGIPYGYSPVIVCLPDTLKNKPHMVKSFLSATGEGFAYAAANVEHASNILMEIANRENPGMPKMLEPNLVLESLKYLSKHFLDDSGKWGFMDTNAWKRFVDWLSAEGLLTTLIQSRKPLPGISASLEDLRSGNAGDVVKPSDLNLQDVFTNAYLA